jgi:hypothetical protein
MKNAMILLTLVTCFILNTSAQQKKQAHNLLISTYEEDYGISKTHVKVIVTKDDGTQEEKNFKIHPDSYYTKNIKEKEDSVMQTLKPYFDDGWKLVASTSIVIPNSGNNILTRYFLRKEAE